MLKSRRIIVTGGAGFIGSTFIKYILNNTNHKITNIDNLTYAGSLDNLREIENSKRYNFHKINISNYKKLKKIILHTKPDYVVHFAAESHVDNSFLFPEKFISTNINGTFKLIKASYEYWNKLTSVKKKLFKFLHVSTDEVYGDLGKSKKLFNENSNYNPSSPYSASKASSDFLVSSWGRTFKFPYIITHSSNNYGPNQNQEKLIPKIIKNAYSNKSIPIYGNGKQERDWIYVNDNVDAIYNILLFAKPFQSFCIGGINQVKNIDLVNKILDLMSDFSLKYNFKLLSKNKLIKYVEDRKGHDIKYGINIKKLEQELGWHPKKNFDEGLKETIEWYLSNLAAN